MNKPRNLTAIISINVQLLIASLCGVGAWAIWPQTPEWWGLGVMSVMLASSSLAALGNAWRTAVTTYRRERALADYAALGAGPKSAAMANGRDLKRAGMIDVE